MPSIDNGGLEKSLINYLNYFSKDSNISLVTNTNNHKQLSLISKKVKIINFKIKFLIQFRILNNLFCAILLLKFLSKKTIIFSVQEHFFILLLKFFGLMPKFIKPYTIVRIKKHMSINFFVMSQNFSSSLR